MQTIDRIVDEEPDVEVLAEPHPPEVAEPAEPQRPTLASAGRVLVDARSSACSCGRCSRAPILERNAEAGPVGTRRTAALAVLRPLLAISDTLLLSHATARSSVPSAATPRASPAASSSCRRFDLPPEFVEPVPIVTVPAEPEPSPAGPRPEPAVGAEPATGEGDGDASLRNPRRSESPRTSNKLRVAVIGDSLSQGLGPAIERWMDPGVRPRALARTLVDRAVAPGLLQLAGRACARSSRSSARTSSS